ncbi:MAG: hypothetical protein P8X74_13035 [Reinekea sp.]
MLPKNWGEPMGAPAMFEKQIEIKLLHSASILESRIQVQDTTLASFSLDDTSNCSYCISGCYSAKLLSHAFLDLQQ